MEKKRIYLSGSPEQQKLRREKGWHGIISERFTAVIPSLGPGGNDLDSHLVRKYGNRESFMEHLCKAVRDSSGDRRLNFEREL